MEKQQKSTGKKKERSIVNRIFVISLCVLLSAYAVSIIITLIWGLLTSFKNPYDLSINNNWIGFPTLDKANLANSREYLFGFLNYKIIFQDYHLIEDNCKISFITGTGERITHYASGGFAMVIVNTFVYTIVGSLLHTIIPALTAYAVTKFDNWVGRIVTGAALFAMTTPIVGNQGAMLNLLRGLGIYDTFWGYLLQKATFTGMYFFVFSAFYQSLPDSFSEAAEIDGASYYNILWSIIIPLSVKMMSTVFLIQFISFWNDYQTANLYMPSHPTLAYAVWWMTQNNQFGGGEPVVRIASTMMLAMPILVAFIFLKDKLMGNVTMGGLKQ